MEIRVKIILNTKKEKVELLSDGRLEVSVSADRKQGEANSRMQKLLANHFGVEEKDVTLVGGHTSRTKLVRVRPL
jgi:uncharacterized protein YggU (UPF0235/DUF167 family)